MRSVIPFYIYRALAFLLARYELIPGPGGARYLSRWHFPSWFARLHRSEYLFLHHFHTSDPDRGWHNHPWEWCESTILSGAYTQEVRRQAFTLLPGRKSIGLVWATDYEDFVIGDRNRLEREFHRVLLAARPVWTLFRAGAKHGKSWGFIDHAGKFTPANAPGAREGMH